MAHYFTDNRDLPENRKEHSFRFSGRTLVFTTDDGVFSKGGVDYGTRVLLEACSKEELTGDVLDLGCGYGVIGIALKTLRPELNVTCSDVNPRAAELAAINAEKNKADCNVIVSDGFAEIDSVFDAVITNPPIRTGKKVIYGMFEDAHAHLKSGGVFLAVIRRAQGAESAKKKLAEIFGECEVVMRDSGYWILRSNRV